MVHVCQPRFVIIVMFLQTPSVRRAWVHSASRSRSCRKRRSVHPRENAVSTHPVVWHCLLLCARCRVDRFSAVKEIVGNHGVVVYSKTYCPYCTKAKKALNEIGAKYEVRRRALC